MSEKNGATTGSKAENGTPDDNKKNEPVYTNDLNEVIAAEKEYISARRKAAINEADEVGETPPPESWVSELNHPVGIANSGGGILAGTFSLGVLQGLAKYKLLPWVDYISSVSGGGFSAGAMVSLLSRYKEKGRGQKKKKVFNFNTRWKNFPFNPELIAFDPSKLEDEMDSTKNGLPNQQLAYVREKGNFIIPRWNSISLDFFRVIGTWLAGSAFTVLIYLLGIALLATTHYMGAASVAPMIYDDQKISLSVSTTSEVETDNEMDSADDSRQTLDLNQIKRLLFYNNLDIPEYASNPLPAYRLPTPILKANWLAFAVGLVVTVLQSWLFGRLYRLKSHKNILSIAMFAMIIPLMLILVALVLTFSLNIPLINVDNHFVLSASFISITFSITAYIWALRPNLKNARSSSAEGLNEDEAIERALLYLQFVFLLLVSISTTYLFRLFLFNDAEGQTLINGIFWIWIPVIYMLGAVVGLGYWRILVEVLKLIRLPFGQRDYFQEIYKRTWGNQKYRGFWYTFNSFTIYALVGFVILNVVLLPQFFAISEPPSGLISISTLITSGLLAFLLSQFQNYLQGKSESSLVDRLLKLSSALQKLILGLLVIAIHFFLIFQAESLLDTYLDNIACHIHTTICTNGKLAPVDVFWRVFGIWAILFATLSILGRLLNFNYLSLHYFFRDRIADVYLKTEVTNWITKKRLNGRDDSWRKLTDINIHGSSTPYHLVLATVNLPGSYHLRYKDRKADNFQFARDYCGSEITGYVMTDHYRWGQVSVKEKKGLTKYARALAISGAAVSSSVGTHTFFAQSFLATLFNIRLGMWMVNPKQYEGVNIDAKADSKNGNDPNYDKEKNAFWPYLLFNEMNARTHERGALINLADGAWGKDSFGLKDLLKRRCRVIIVNDAGPDPKATSGSLFSVIRVMREEENIKIDINMEGLVPVAKDGDGIKAGQCKSHCAVGKIEYPDVDYFGWLIVFKPAVTGDEPGSLQQYWRTNADEFPHSQAVDQFFDEEQFETARFLGEHSVEDTLNSLAGYYGNALNKTHEEIGALSKARKKSTVSKHKARLKRKLKAKKKDYKKLQKREKFIEHAKKSKSKAYKEIWENLDTYISDLQKATSA